MADKGLKWLRNLRIIPSSCLSLQAVLWLSQDLSTGAVLAVPSHKDQLNCSSISCSFSLFSSSPKAPCCLFLIFQCSFNQVKGHLSHHPSFHNKFQGPKLFTEIVSVFLACRPGNGNCWLTTLNFYDSRKNIRFHGRYHYPIQELALRVQNDKEIK